MHWGGRQDFRKWNSGKEEGHRSDDIIYHLNNNDAIALYHDNSDVKKKRKVCWKSVSQKRNSEEC